MFENLGKALALLREVRGLSQVETARAAGIGKSQLSKYESSKELPKLDSLAKVLKALDVGYFELFYTLQFVDGRATSIGTGHQFPMLLGEAISILPETSASILHPATQAAFRTVFADLHTFYAQVVENVVLGQLNETEKDRSGDPLVT